MSSSVVVEIGEIEGCTLDEIRATAVREVEDAWYREIEWRVRMSYTAMAREAGLLPPVRENLYPLTGQQTVNLRYSELVKQVMTGGIKEAHNRGNQKG